ncbi:MAG: universal stress protein [Acidimicrobiales bacterium]|nr:universal stress protein [Acidimicrobiales bacterium]
MISPLAMLAEEASGAHELIPIDEHQLLIFWTQLLVLVTLARSLGWVMRRIGLPSVIGELLAGVLLGPSLFARVWPSGFEWFLPAEHGDVQSAALLAIAWVGVALLLVITGFETDLELIRRLGRAAALVTAFSLLVPLFGGLMVGYALPDRFLGEDTTRLVFALFVAAALAVSSLAVVAKILSELGLMRRDFGQITVAAGMANDVVGWMMLAVFAGIATSGSVSVSGVLTTVGGMVIFGIVAFTLGQRAIDWSLRRVRRDGPNVDGALTVVIISMLAFGVATQALGIEAVLGAFVAGVLLHRSRFQQPEVLERLESITQGFLAPVFFATAGLRVDLGLLFEDDTLVWAAVVLGVALVFKFVGAYVGARAAGQSQRASVALGAGLNARGALEIVIATVGLSLGVLNDTAYTVIVVVPLVTTVLASVSLRWVVRDWLGSDEEKARLEREEALARNIVVRDQRLLLPSLGGPASIAAAQILHFVWPIEAATTVLSVGEVDVDSLVPVMNVLHDRQVEHRVVRDVKVADAIAAEARLGFGAIVVGVAVDHDEGLLSPMVDDLLMVSPIPLIIVRRARNLDRPLPGVFTKALVPVAGTQTAQAAQEVAFSLSDDLGTEITLAHIVNRAGAMASIPLIGRLVAHDEDPALELANKLIAEATERADGMGIRTRTIIKQNSSTAVAIVQAASEVGADLVVLGATVRKVDGRPFLGHNVETVLEQCDATVVVVASPQPEAADTNHLG